MATSNPPLVPRFSTKRVTAALKDTPVVMVTGPRQSGKTTLVQQYVTADRRYMTLDAYFSDRGRLFQSDRGRRFNVIADDHWGARATG
jgi:hypothetical protein